MSTDYLPKEGLDNGKEMIVRLKIINECIGVEGHERARWYFIH